MNMTSIGDLAQGLMLRHRSAQIKNSISTLTDELSSGRVKDVAKRLGNDFSLLTDIDRNLSRLNGFSIAASEAAFFADATQSSLGRMHNLSSSLSSSLIAVTPSNLDTVRTQLSVQAQGDLEAVVSALNTSAGGRSLFAGTATDRSPLASADVLLSELRPLVSSLGSAAAVHSAVDAWFVDPAGFKAAMYSGSDQSLGPIQIGSGQEVALTLKAEDPAFRETLSNFALAALATDTSLGFDRSIQSDLLRLAGEGLLASQDKLVALRSDLGFAEARIEEAMTRNASARSSLEYAKGSLLEADPFDTATRLEEAQFQLESLYTVTVRSSQLSLLNFLR